MTRNIISILLLFSFSKVLMADTDDDSIRFLLRKSTIVVEGIIEEDPMSFSSESGVIGYLLKFEQAKSLSDISVSPKISILANRFYDSKEDALPYLKKGQRCIVFLILRPQSTPVYHTSDMWFSILPYSDPLKRRVILLNKNVAL